MPSYRLILTVANVLNGADPAVVLPQSAQTLGKYVNVESFDVRISRGKPQLVLRYTAADKLEALGAAHQAVNEISSFIEVTSAQNLQRVHGRWEYI